MFRNDKTQTPLNLQHSIFCPDASRATLTGLFGRMPFLHPLRSRPVECRS
jgi:hypothetical protein